MNALNAYTYTAKGSDGHTYGVRLMLHPDEFEQLQRVGLIPAHTQRIVGMQEAADTLVAMYERQEHSLQ